MIAGLLAIALLPCTTLGLVASQVKPRQASVTATADLGVSLGAPQHLASGFIYGIPDTVGQVPNKFYTDIGFNYARVGGAQLAAPCRGWIWGLAEYRCRLLTSSLSNYKVARTFGARVQLLIHDVWGTDHANSSTVWPGDNGNWTDWDKYVAQLIADLKANNMIAGLDIDIWNEPEGSFFWARSTEQWVELFGRTYKAFRADPAFNSVLLVGPSHASMPNPNNVWWTRFLDYIKANNTIPDQYTWHIEGSSNDVNDDLKTNNATLASMLSSRGLPTRPVNINEYGTVAEQNPQSAIWHISRLERYGAHGLRGNWLSGLALHDFFANLLSKPNANTASYDPLGGGYFPNGEYQVYKYYNLNMTGHRVQTTGSSDRVLDLYATVGTDKVRILVGGRLKTGTWQVTLNHLSAVGLPTSGTLNIQTWGFVWGGTYTEEETLSNRGIVAHTYSGDTVTFPIFQTDTTTGWAFEFNV